jgi:hypothetical protein
MDRFERIQLQVTLPYKKQPAEHPRIRAYLERGYRVVHLQRVTDQESLVTLAPPPGGAAAAGG